MAGGQSKRQKMSGQARRAAAAAARRKAARRRRNIAIATVAVIAVTAGLVAAFNTGDEAGEQVASSSTTTARTAGKPCVAVSEPLPPGAPAVPVKEGPPPTQLVTEDLKVGEGDVVAPNSMVTVNYIGVACSTGKIFDSSYVRNQPATFSLSGVIKGWQDGIPGMKIGGQRLLGIPPDVGYGAEGQPPDIGPNETLWFVVDVLDAKPT